MSAKSIKRVLRKKHKKSEVYKKNATQIYYGTIAGLLLLFSFIRKIISPFDEILQNCGIFMQMIMLCLGIYALNRAMLKFNASMPENLNRGWLVMLKIYIIVCLIIALISVNSLNFSIFALAK